MLEITLAILACGAISGLTAFIGMSKALERFDFYPILADAVDALVGDEENIAKIYGIGQVFARGMGDGLGLGKLTKKKSGKIFGLPAEIVLPIIQSFLPKITGKATEKVAEATAKNLGLG